MPEAIAASMRPTSLLVCGIAAVFGGMIIFNAFLGQSGPAVRPSAPSEKLGKITAEGSDKTSRTVTLKYDELIEDVQRELLATGHFQGLVDGVDGPKTHVAIEAYQQQNGLPITGISSKQLLEHIRFMKKVAQASEFTGSINATEPSILPEPELTLVAPKKRVVIVEPFEPEVAIVKPRLKEPTKALVPKTPKVAEKKLLKPVDKHVEKQVEKPVVKAKAKLLPKPDQIAKIIAASGLPRQTATLKLQQRLAKLGFDPGTRSGEMDEATRAAILGFELDHGLNMEGKVTKALMLALKTAEEKRQAALKN